MANRGQKRNDEVVDELPADKRACSSLEKRNDEVVDELPADKHACSSLELCPCSSTPAPMDTSQKAQDVTPSSDSIPVDTAQESQDATAPMDTAQKAQDATDSSDPTPMAMDTAHESQNATGSSPPTAMDSVHESQNAGSLAQTPMDPVHEPQDADMDTSSSTSGSARSEGDGEKESPYGSCDSDNSLHNYYGNQSVSDQSKFKKMLSSLSVELEESGQLVLLTQLCELLSFCSDGSLSSHMADSLSPILVRLAKSETNPDIMLLAIRSITYMCDQNTRSSGFLVRHDAVPALCQRLMAIEYLDVAEQCLQALEKISREQPMACLQSGAIMAVLCYIDFFSTSVQRVALSTVSNICKKLSSESSSLFMEAVPILCNLLQCEDRQLVESVATCLITIVDQVYSSPNVLDEICNHQLVQHTLHLIGINSRTTLCQPTYIGLLGLLVKLVSGSTIAFRKLFELDISNTCKEMLSTYCVSHGLVSTPMLDGRHSQITEVLKLLNELLPKITAEQDDQQKSYKEAFLLSHPDILQKFGVDLLPILTQVVNSGVNLCLCYGCLSIINKLVHFTASDALHSLLQTANIPSFLAGVFMRKDQHVIILALQIVDSIMLKLPHVYLNSFIKEGVLFAIYALLSQDKDLKLKSAAPNVHRCPCFTFELAQSSNSPGNVTCKIHETTQDLAKRIWTTYFETESVNPEKGVTDILQKLRTLSTVLTAIVDKSLEDPSSEYEEDIYDILHQIMTELNKKDSISAFEFVESGIIKALVSYLSNGRYLVRKEDSNMDYHLFIMEKRFEVFGRLLVSSSDTAREEFPLLMLIKRLQSALSSFENFPVISNHKYKRRDSYASVPYERCISHQCLKVQFVRENGEVGLRDYADAAVSVDPFVPLDEIEGYLRPRVSNDKTKDLTSGSQDSKENDSLCSSSPPDSSTSQEGKPDSLLSSPEDVAEVETDIVKQEEHSLLPEDDGMNMDHPESSGSEYKSEKLLLYLEGQQLNPELTLYQSIMRQKNETEHDINPSTSFWTHRYKINYRRDKSDASSNAKSDLDKDLHSLLSKRSAFFQYSPMLMEAEIENLDPAYDVLSLLKFMEGINRLRFHLVYGERTHGFAKGEINDLDMLKVVVTEVPANQFVNKKLTEKLEQQLRDPMSVSVGAMPAWCTQLMDRCPFLFGFETRCSYFHLAALGRSPSQTRSTSEDHDVGSSDRHQNHRNSPRKRILVHRDKILESASQMMEHHANHKVLLEVEYVEEVGTGLGPTLEFYTLVCREFQISGLGMWRDDCLSRQCTGDPQAENAGIIVSPFGLFPRPWSPSPSTSSGTAYSEVIKKFSLLGYMVAKALQDGRVLDLPFSKAFYRLILGEDLTLYDIQSFDPDLGRAILEFRAIVEKREYLRSRCEKNSHDLDICLRNMRIEDLCLDFTLPGYPDYSLVSDSKMVNLDNLDEYVTLMVDATTKSGVVKQVEAFKSGFDQVFPIRHLKVFTEEELERLLCGEHVPWNSDELLEHIKFDHGYTISSPPIVNLLEIMQEFDLKQQRAFLQFVTGAPRLPTGGLSSLSPKLTIVRKVGTKHCMKGIDVDLPSVMTCANYLKLPPYSSKEVMKEKLLYAIIEGQGSFHLS